MCDVTEHLLLESKQECNRYKQKHDDLALRLDSLTRRLPPAQSTSLAAAGMTVLQPIRPTVATAALAGNVENPAAEGHDHQAAARFEPGSLDLVDVMESGGDRKSGGGGGSAASSPSFVRINSASSDDQSPSSLVSNTFDNRQVTFISLHDSVIHFRNAVSGDSLYLSPFLLRRLIIGD